MSAYRSDGILSDPPADIYTIFFFVFLQNHDKQFYNLISKAYKIILLSIIIDARATVFKLSYKMHWCLVAGPQ